MKTMVGIWRFPTIWLVLMGYNAIALQARVVVAQAGTNFTYTVFNDQAPGSSLFLSNFHLELNAPFTVAASPAGWSFITDNFSYVDWFCANTLMPFPQDVAPGTSLGGFVIASVGTNSESLSYALVSWEHGATTSGPALQGFVAAPSILGVEAKLSEISYARSNAFEFTVIGIPSFNYSVQSSADFVNWTPFSTNSVPFRIVETNTLSPRRFYRAAPAFDVLTFSQD